MFSVLKYKIVRINRKHYFSYMNFYQQLTHGQIGKSSQAQLSSA